MRVEGGGSSNIGAFQGAFWGSLRVLWGSLRVL